MGFLFCSWYFRISIKSIFCFFSSEIKHSWILFSSLTLLPIHSPRVGITSTIRLYLFAINHTQYLADIVLDRQAYKKIAFKKWAPSTSSALMDNCVRSVLCNYTNPTGFFIKKFFFYKNTFGSVSAWTSMIHHLQSTNFHLKGLTRHPSLMIHAMSYIRIWPNRA